MGKKTPDTTPGLGATEVDARGPVRVLVVREQSRNSLTNGVLEEAISTAVAAGGILATFVDSTSNSTLHALIMLRRAKKINTPFEIVLSGLDLSDSQVGGLQIADAVGNENLARHFILFNQGFIPEGLMRGRAVPIYALNYPGVSKIVDALNKGVQTVLTPTPRTA